MRSLLAIAGREFRSAFLGPLAWVVLALWMGLIGLFFYTSLLQFNQLCLVYQSQMDMNEELARFLDVNFWVVRVIFDFSLLLLLFLVPLLTMRALADERRLGTAEFLLTSPVTPAQVVWGKFLAVLAVAAVMIAATLQFPLFLFAVGDPDWGPVWAGYLGLLLLAGAFIATGLFASSLTENPIIAGVVSFFLLLVALFLSALAERAPAPWSMVLGAVAPSTHYEDFAKGIVDTGHLLFFVSWTFFFLFLTERVLESQRWR